MDFIYLFLILKILLNFQNSNCFELLKTDYYESLSYPRQCLIVSHYHHSGPRFLYVKFKYGLSSLIFGYVFKNITLDIGFKKIDTPCSNSITFITMGKDFRKLELYIYIKFFYGIGIITYINYNIYKGIATGIYELWDIEQHFTFRIKILNDINGNLITSNSSLNYIESYLNSISSEREEICLVTENNKAVILKPEYGKYKPNGLLTGFTAFFYRDREYLGLRYYPAFECEINPNYPNETVILIIDQFVDIYLKVSYSKFRKDAISTTDYLLQIPNAKYEYVNYIENIPLEHKKLFLLKRNKLKIDCVDGTERLQYSSLGGIIYYATESKFVNVSFGFEQAREFSRLPADPCF